MIVPPVAAALARGALVVTPNKRLAREIVHAHDGQQIAAGRAAWPSARVLPWTTFVAGLVGAAQDAGLALPMQRLDAAQAGQLWRRILARDVERLPLVDADAIAEHAAEAWETLHAWGEGGASWRGFTDGSDDVEAFARWSEAYARELARLDAVDTARAPEALAAIAASLPAVTALDVVVTGFIERSRQQSRLLDALAAAGATVDIVSPTSAPLAHSSACVVACATARDELDRALDWARERAQRSPGARIGIVVPDLASRREAVRAACEERLCAPLQWPGREEELRPYDITFGEPLADTPLVASALALIGLAQRPLDRSHASALLRSPYLPDADAKWMARSALERRWLERGEREIDWPMLVADLQRIDPDLAARWSRLARGAARGAQSPHAWVDRWRAWLAAAGWCEGHAMSSLEFQTEGAWNELLAAFVRLAAVAPALGDAEAHAALVRLARAQLFQPQGTGARIRVLGLLEASGLAFDALWVAGMAADAWPRAPMPSPLLPLAWQCERGVPRASAERELAFAREVTAGLAHAAPAVVFSYAALADDHARTASPLVAGLPVRDAPVRRDSTAARMFAARPALEAVADASAPPVAPAGRLPGGSGVIEKFSACPFQATAVYRLRAEAWTPGVIGLTPIERGKLVHAMLDAFWRATGTQASLLAMSDEALLGALSAAFAHARACVPDARWRALPPAVAASEESAVAALVRQWIDAERRRPPFSVAATESKVAVTLAGYTLDVRLDRVDRLDAGGVAVVDYKTGNATSPARWFADRPQGLQLALYAKARAQVDPGEPVRALAYAQLRAGSVRAVGISDDPATWPGLSAPDEVKGAGLVDWDDARATLDASVEALAAGFAAGDARIAPRPGASVCRLCGLRPLCRIGAVADAGEGADE